MSQENVEIIRKTYEAFAQGGMDAVLGRLHPKVELYPAPDFPGPEVYRGHEGFVAWLEQFGETFEDFRIEPDEFTSVGDQVLVPVRIGGRGKGSGADVEMRRFQVWTLRDGKVVRVDAYQAKAEALEAVGLQE